MDKVQLRRMTCMSPPSARPNLQIIPNLALLALARPLTHAAGHTYAAIWPHVNRPVAPSPPPGSAARLSRELVLVRDDGQLLFDLLPDPGPPRRSDAQAAAPLDCYLPRHPPLPDDRLWSGAGVQRYLDGYRPDPAAVFASLVAVMEQFVDFTGSLGPPDLMAEFFATYILTTWLSPAFPFLGLLWLTGDNGSGKSRLLALLARLAHLGLFLPVPPPSSALRALASLGATLAVDDADFLGPRANRGQWALTARYALLLAGRQRGALLPVTLDPPGRLVGLRHTRQLDVSGPRLFASVHPPHPSIARYFVVVPLVRTAQATLAAADPDDPAAWPAGLTLAGLVDELWALALSHLRHLPPHLPLAAQAAASPSQPIPLLGSSIQPWHALLATAGWLSTVGVPGLLERLLGLAQAYHQSRPAAQTADVTVLVLRALFACVSHAYSQLIDRVAAAALSAYDHVHGAFDDNRFDADTNDADTNDDDTADDAYDAKKQNAARLFERRAAREAWTLAYITNPDRAAPPLPTSFAVTSADILDAMRELAADLDPEPSLDSLTPNLIGRILRQLRLVPHRSANTRLWIITPATLARLARAYGLPLPNFLAAHFPAAPAPSSTTPPP